jgi:hypothetical protein
MTDEATRLTLHQVAVHVVARARQQATGRFSLRVTPGGFGTPEFGTEGRRVRVSDGLLIVESDAEAGATTLVRPIGGASLRELAELAEVDLAHDLDVGPDSVEQGDLDEPIVIDLGAVREITDWLALAAAALDRVAAAVEPASISASLARLWPEHFDVAIDLAARPGVRANCGASPGDAFSSEPYLYVGPWTEDRPGGPGYWNAPFGAACQRSALQGDDLVQAAAEFMLDGLRRLADYA